MDLLQALVLGKAGGMGQHTTECGYRVRWYMIELRGLVQEQLFQDAFTWIHSRLEAWELILHARVEQLVSPIADDKYREKAKRY